jgi:hypothetical protein
MFLAAPLLLPVVSRSAPLRETQPEPRAARRLHHANAAGSSNGRLVGAWTTKVQFVSGAFATLKDLKYMLVFNAGGTMTESSNYDEAQPVPPAYGIWRRTGKNQFELHYEYFNTKQPAKFEEIASGGGWNPSGYGVIVEKVKLSVDGNSYTSKMTLVLHDNQGKVITGGGKALCKSVRMKF